MKKQYTATAILPLPKAIFCLIFILQFSSSLLWGQQVAQRNLTVNDYPKWGSLGVGEMSSKGEWLSYGMYYEHKKDTLFIKNTKSLKTIAFPGGSRGSFIAENWYVFYSASGMNLVNLQNGKQQTISGALYHVYAGGAKALLIFVQREKETALIIRHLDIAGQERLDGVKEFILDPGGNRLLYTTVLGADYSIGLLELTQKNVKNTLMSGAAAFHNLAWHKQGKAIAFLQKSSGLGKLNTIHLYDISARKFQHSSASVQQLFFGDSLYIAPSLEKLKISDDMQRVVFSVKAKLRAKDSLAGSAVQIWNGNSKLIYPREERQKKLEKTYYALWRPFEDQYRLISSDSLPQMMLTGDQKYAVLSSPYAYEPHYQQDGPRDIYLADLSTGERELFLKKHPGSPLYTLVSPSGNYIAYFQQKNWWVYDIEKKKRTNITQNINTSFFHNTKEHPRIYDLPYTVLGWTLDDKAILLRDEYDIWAVDSDGSASRRLTQGRETSTRFRVAGLSSVVPAIRNFNGLTFNTIDLAKGLLLESVNEKKHYGYYQWSSAANRLLVLSTGSRLDQLLTSVDGKIFAYTEERYDLSPRLMLVADAGKKPKVIVQSNTHQKDFRWGKSELISYKNSKGKDLQGILFYPAGYDKEKKYPMIMLIYEKLSAELHSRYINPSMLAGQENGFNISTFTTNGYFVLAADISYEIGNPGISATDCVLAAANAVIARGLVRVDKIGLLGHSFGGYETDFIITQTKLFAAAVAGAAGATDLTSDYLSVGIGSGRPEMWRFESQQMRMGKSLFDDRAAYDRNSPVVHAKNIATPLLSWTGDADPQVNWSQSLEFYLALHRLGKKHIMLVYPKEGHNLSQPKNELDLAVRIHDWFDYHLKDLPAAPWINKGLN